MKARTGSVTLLTLLGSMACEPQACPHVEQNRLVDGDVALTAGAHVTHVTATSYEALALDDPCGDGGSGCVRVGDAWQSGLTFARPAETGTFDLRDLRAKVCDLVVADAAVIERCDDVDGTLDVRDVGDDHIDATLELAPALAARSITATGNAHLVAFEATVDAPCTRSGCRGGLGPDE